MIFTWNMLLFLVKIANGLDNKSNQKTIFRVWFDAATLTAHIVSDILSVNFSSRLTFSDMFKRTAQ